MSVKYITPEIARIMNSIAIFLLRYKDESEKLSNDNYFLYNLWTQDSGIVITNTELAFWCVKYIKRLSEMPIDDLKRAVEIDNI